jgi:hypothetical protein
MAPSQIWKGPIGRALVLAMKAERREGETLIAAIRRLVARGEPWDKWDEITLQHKYPIARRHHGDSPMPMPIDELMVFGSAKQSIVDAPTCDRWMFDLLEWGKEPKRRPVGMSTAQARDLIKRLLAIPEQCRPHVDHLFVHMERRVHWNGRQKIEWLQSVPDRLNRNPFDWPIPPSKRGRRDVNTDLVLDFLEKVPADADKDEIQAATGIKPTTLQNLLVSLERSKRVTRTDLGRYASPAKELAAHVSTDAAILNFLANGPAFFDEIRAGTGKTEGEVAGGIHRLKKAKKIDLIHRGKRARYALAGMAQAHVYAGDAVDQALESGSKIMRELEEATGKKRGELWAAIDRKVAKGEIVKAYLINVGHRGRLAAFALAPAL